MAQIRRNRDIEEDDFDVTTLGDLDVPVEFSAQSRAERDARREEKQQRTLAQFIRDACVC